MWIRIIPLVFSISLDYFDKTFVMLLIAYFQCLAVKARAVFKHVFSQVE